MNASLIKGTKASGDSKTPPDSTFENSLPGVSIVIPFRNEANNLPDLLKSLEAQNYPKDQLEFILVDDHSEEMTFF